ncbi:MAG: hypothetical protein AB1782_10570 [Cyanobacteriota bacterium]
MGIANCQECGKIFSQDQENICRDCVRERENHLSIIRDWIAKQEKPTLENIEKETGIPEKNFRKYLIESRIMFFKKVWAQCEVCGQKTRLETKNIICKDCRSSLKKPSGIPVQEKKELENTELYSKSNKCPKNK